MAIQANVLLPEVSRPVLAFPSGAPSTSVSTYINTANYDVISFVIQVTNDSTGGVSNITLNQATSATGTRSGPHSKPLTLPPAHVSGTDRSG